VKTNYSARLGLGLLAVIMLGVATSAYGVPVAGEIFHLKQPDGSLVDVRIWGDEFYQVVESLDGYTLVRDPSTGIICYADLSPDGTQLLSTGTVVTQQSTSATTGVSVPAHVRIRQETVHQIVAATRARRSRVDPSVRSRKVLQ
jgi:hypothetical protein